MKRILLVILLFTAIARGASPWYVTHNAGGGGVGSSGDPWTLTEAIDTVAAGETVYVKATGAYQTEYATGGGKGSVMYFATDGTAALPIHWIGYKTTAGDGGVVTIDADSALDEAGEAGAGDYHIIENFTFIGANRIGFNAQNMAKTVWKRCSFGPSPWATMYQPESQNTFIACRFHDGTVEGVDCTNSQQTFIGCVFEGNGKEGIHCTISTFFAFCDFYDNGKTSDFKHVLFNSSAAQPVFVNCTFDGENTGNSFYQLGTWANTPIFVNCIVYDNANALDGAASGTALAMFCVNNSNTNFTNNILPVPTNGDGVGDDGNVTGAPTFTAEASDDYSLASGSSAIGAAFNAQWTREFWADFDGATNPPTVGATNGDIGGEQSAAAVTTVKIINKSGGKQ